MPDAWQIVLYNGNPGRGTRMLCPGFAKTRIQCSKALEHPEVIRTSDGVIV